MTDWELFFFGLFVGAVLVLIIAFIIEWKNR